MRAPVDAHVHFFSRRVTPTAINLTVDHDFKITGRWAVGFSDCVLTVADSDAEQRFTFDDVSFNGAVVYVDLIRHDALNFARSRWKRMARELQMQKRGNRHRQAEPLI